MAADRDAILAQCTDLDPGDVQSLLTRAGTDYLDRFDPPAIAEHLRRLLAILPDSPVALILGSQADGAAECTVLAFDHPFEFSLITGMLAATGFSIESSDVFTLDRPPAPRPPRPQPPRRRPLPRRRDSRTDAVIIDHFRGRLLGPLDGLDRWAAVFQPAITETLTLLDRGDEQATEKAKRLVNERVTGWLAERRAAGGGSAGLRPPLGPGDMRLEQLPASTRLSIHAPDAPAFLYALSTALSLHGLSIRKMRIRTPHGQAVDEVDFTDAAGRPLTDPQRLDSVRLSVLLTQQFAYALDRAPDPFTALSRFEKLAEQIAQTPERAQWLELLSSPSAMAGLARVLGASDYLWEDFIRLHAESLLPIFHPRAQGTARAPRSASLPRRLDEALAGASGIDEQEERLNQFKDRELFLIDLDHILSSEDPDASFRLLSERLVLLAENLVAKAAALVYDDLLRRYGRPLDDRGAPIPWAVCGLGKLGGVALGYASDIELLFVYGSSGPTQGGEAEPTSAEDFFGRLAQQTAKFIRAKREGIFRVDLRLRPFSTDGPPACSRQQFAEYYRPGGHAHPFETLAMVRLRWLAGDAQLGFDIEQLRDEFLYDAPMLDLDAIWDIWAKMRSRHVAPGQTNSKYSPGALTDLEGAVQLLQVKHARQAPQLRTPRLHEAIEGLRRAAILPPAEYEQLMEAYQFLRRLINAQRMLRGSAQDLLLPPPGSDELLHLARRMDPAPGPSHQGAELLSAFRQHTDAVRRFIQRHFARPCPGG